MPYLTRGWFRKGSKPTIKTTHTKERFAVFGALSKSEFSAQLTEEKCNAQTWIQFLKSLIRKYGKIIIVVDGAKYHFEKEHVQKFYEENKHKLNVIQLPPYSPKLNPIEQVWKKIKKWLAITPWATKKEFEMKLVEALNNPNFMVKMFDYYGN
ncbi:MAG: IS630 family transposase [Pseudomonadota bacterium]